MAGQGPIDIEKPGSPTGPTGPMWPVKDMPWNDKPNPWIQPPASPNDGGRISPPAGQDPDGRGPRT